jgi:hypothetical protein
MDKEIGASYLPVRPNLLFFLIKMDILSASLAGTEYANSLLSSISLICVKIPRSRPSGTTVESVHAYDHSMERYWQSKKGNFDTLHLYALNHLSCPGMAIQCERVFSAARRTLTLERNSIVMKIIETYEYCGGVDPIPIDCRQRWIRRRLRCDQASGENAARSAYAPLNNSAAVRGNRFKMLLMWLICSSHSSC